MATTLADTLNGLIPFLDPLANTVISLSRSSPETAVKVQGALVAAKSGITDLALSQTAVQSKPIADKIKAAVVSILNTAAAMPLPFPESIIFSVLAGLAPQAFNVVDVLLAHHVTVPTVAAPVPVAA